MSTRRKASVRLGLLVALVAPAAAATLPGTAALSDTAERIDRVSAVNPQPGCSAYADGDASFPAIRDWDQEPHLTASLTSPQHLVTAWMQGFSDGISTARSDDAGRTWSVSAVPVLDCGQTHSTIDPSLATGPRPGGGETTYLSTRATTPPTGVNSPTGALADTEMLVVRSFDGGASWTAPVELDRATDATVIDGSQVVTDPRRPGHAFARWSRVNLLGFSAGVGAVDEYVATTDDGFATASGRHITRLPDVPVGSMALGTQLLVRPDGGLLAVSSVAPATQPGLVVSHAAPQLPPLTGPTDIYVTASDDGVTWSPQRNLGQADASRFVLLGTATDGAGRMGISWMRSTAAGQQPMLLLSRDSGRSWGPEQLIGPASSGPVFDASNGLVVPPTLVLSQETAPRVLFYDYRRDTPVGRTDPGTPHTTDVWTRWQVGGRWLEQHVAGPFDRTTGPWQDSSVCSDSTCTTRPAQLGDYWGGAAIGQGEVGFAFVTTNPTPDSPHNTDVFFARVRDVR